VVLWRNCHATTLVIVSFDFHLREYVALLLSNVRH